MAVVSFLILMCVALSSPTAGLRPNRLSLEPSELDPLDIPPCWPGWTHSDDRCYKLFKTLKTWTQASADCTLRGSNLISVRNGNDLSAVQSVMGLEVQKGVWIGGTDAVTEGQWWWRNGEPFSWTFWSPGQPDNLGEEDCMSVGIGGLAYDEKCNKNLYYACSKKLQT
ncbi:galactose-specific lectin nattectin-like [Triplophysa rosa]|uniref:galactose-specific lectin nattectin-like n=1 Tax=Triplophysa rosa TaxID=992332 RepID=UPI00254628E8|nr:galactose-specific lectin nattectin-like [Triplophysa rosa]